MGQRSAHLDPTEWAAPLVLFHSELGKLPAELILIDVTVDALLRKAPGCFDSFLLAFVKSMPLHAADHSLTCRRTFPFKIVRMWLGIAWRSPQAPTAT